MTVSYRTKLVLAFRSGDRCAFPGCDNHLSVDGASANTVVVGQAAHIAGENPGAARYDQNMTDEARNAYPNLIYLCGDHHTRIDKQEVDFSVAKLLQMKVDHEERVREALTEAFAEVGFVELGAQYICTLNSDGVPRDDFPAGFNFDQYIRLVLRDRVPEERLLGFEFDQS